MDERKVREIVGSELATFFSLSPLAGRDGSASPVDTVQIGPKAADTVEAQRMEAFGDVCMPPDGVLCITFFTNSGAAHLPLGGSRYRPGGFGHGDRALYCEAPSTLVLLEGATGAVKLNSGTPEGGTQGDVVVNGGTLKVARDTEPVKPTATMQDFLAKAVALINAAVPGSITPAQELELQLQIGSVNGGAAHLKA